MANFLSSIRYLLADIIGEDDELPPSLPENLPEGTAPIVSEAIRLLIDYQGPSYAQLYVDRLRQVCRLASPMSMPRCSAKSRG